MTEVWKDVEGFPGYRVSSEGRVMGKRGTVLRPKDNRGYKAVVLSGPSSKKYTSVHRLVAMTFLDCPEPRDGHEVNHINGVKDDNRVENLEWCTHRENMKHAVETGLVAEQRRADNANARLNETQVRIIRRCFDLGLPNTYIGPVFGVTYSTIWLIRKGRLWAE